MGKKGPLQIVTPKEFKERTSLRLSSRSGTTVTLDKAYEQYFASPTPIARDNMYRALQQYREAHGGAWNLCERNAVSGGLLEWLHNEVAPDSVRISPQRAVEIDRRAAENIEKVQIPHARYGVLYFLANIELDMDIASVVVEGISTVGGVVGASLSTDFGQLGSATNSAKTAFSAGGQAIKGSHVVAGARGVLSVAQIASESGGTVAVKPIVAPAQSWFPTSEAALNRVTSGLSEYYNEHKYLGGLAYVGAGIASPLIATGAVLADGAIAIKRGAKALWDMLVKAFGSVGAMIMGAWRDKGSIATAQKAGALCKAATKFILDLVMKNALPFLGGAIELGSGLVRTIDEICTRVATAWDRGRIRLQPGHAESMANAVEHQMTMGIFKGLADVIKGAAKVTVGVMVPGLGSLVAVVMAAIEWMIKLIYRLLERSAIAEFLVKARKHYQVEKERAQLQPGPAKGAHGHRVPNNQPGGIITDTVKFTAFFEDGCKASPLIPMLTLNSGLAGSLMTLVKLFDVDGSQSTKLSYGRKEFDIGGTYFERLKRYSAVYLKACGFQFRPLDLNDNLMRGYLAHATGAVRFVKGADGKELKMESHVAAGTWAGRAVAIARA